MEQSSAKQGREEAGKLAILFDFFGVIHRGGMVDSKTLKLVADLRSRGLRTTLFSNVSQARFEELREEHNLGDYFDAFFTSSYLGYLKPDLEAFRKVLRELQTDPSRVIFVDDSPMNVEAAQNLGIAGIKFESLAQVKSDLEQVLEERGGVS
jgi:putative hydrolase of the HAD superfamily